MTAAADVSKGQTYMSYKGEHQTLTEQSMRHHVCPSDTWTCDHITDYPAPRYCNICCIQGHICCLTLHVHVI